MTFSGPKQIGNRKPISGFQNEQREWTITVPRTICNTSLEGEITGILWVDKDRVPPILRKF